MTIKFSFQQEIYLGMFLSFKCYRPTTQTGNFELDLDGDEIDDDQENEESGAKTAAVTSPGIKPLGKEEIQLVRKLQLVEVLQNCTILWKALLQVLCFPEVLFTYCREITRLLI